MQLVAVTEVQDEVEAEALLGLLRENGIECWCRRTDIAAGAWTGWACTGGPLEVLVRETDAAAARALLPERVT
jgi:Putative prokaryotic signal transducing protein